MAARAIHPTLRATECSHVVGIPHLPAHPSQLAQVTKEEYVSVGSPGLLAQLEADLRDEGLKPFVIPVGGSNALGTWGYLQVWEV